MFVLSSMANEVKEGMIDIITPALVDLFSVEGTPWQQLESQRDTLTLKGPLEKVVLTGEDFLHSGLRAEGHPEFSVFLGSEDSNGFQPLATIELVGPPGELHFAEILRATREEGLDRYGLLVDRVLRRESEFWGDQDFTLGLIEVPAAYLTLVIGATTEAGATPRVYELDLSLSSDSPGSVRRVAVLDLQERVRWLMARREQDGDGLETGEEG